MKRAFLYDRCMKRRINKTVIIVSAAAASLLFLFSCVSDLSRNEDLPFSPDTASAPVLSDINGMLPDSVYITTLTQTFCRGHSFCLYDGKILVKKRGGARWMLFQKTGLPFSRKSSSIPRSGWFPSPSRIVEIGADDDTLLAFDDRGHMYICPLFGGFLDKKYEWSDGFGWPEKLPLVKDDTVRNYRGWATGTRRGTIEWYTDRFGNEHHWGTMGVTTVYFLCENGQEIRFTDSGLPAEFSNTILGPERGSFTAENISASGSTVFLIGKDGTMYTRLIDYDTMGCDPMFFKYTYIPWKQPYKGSDYRSNFTPWGLPNEDWKKQPPVPLAGKARLTKYLSIFQNGKGNDARMLRVAGLSSDGTPGYYRKSITGGGWTFEEAPLELDASAFLPAPSEAGTPYASRQEYRYRGIVSRNGKTVPGCSCSISDMTLTSEGSCTLAVRYGGEEKRIPLYLVEMWTYMKRHDPVFDGTAKSFFATPHFSDSDLSASSAELSSVLHEVFGGKNLKLFAFTMTAAGPYLTLSAEEKNKSYAFTLSSYGVPQQTGIRSLPATLSGADGDADDSQEETLKKKTLLDTSRTYTADDVPLLDTIEGANREYITLLSDNLKKYSSEAAHADISRWGYNTADIIATVTLLNQVDVPKIKTMTSFGGTLMNTNAENFRRMSEFREFTSPSETALAERRIQECLELKSRIAAEGSAHTGPLFSNTYPGYFSIAHIPQEITGEGAVKGRKHDGVLSRLDSAEDVPAMLLRLSDGGGSRYMLVLFPDLIKNAEAEIRKHDSPFTLPVTYLMMSSGDSSPFKIGQDKLFSSRKGTFSMDNGVITLSMHTIASLDKSRVLFKGKLSDTMEPQ
jgi:hypothetical protein